MSAIPKRKYLIREHRDGLGKVTHFMAYERRRGELWPFLGWHALERCCFIGSIERTFDSFDEAVKACAATSLARAQDSNRTFKDTLVEA